VRAGAAVASSGPSGRPNADPNGTCGRDDHQIVAVAKHIVVGMPAPYDVRMTRSFRLGASETAVPKVDQARGSTCIDEENASLELS
jgi:hypothetical protein